MPRLISLIGFCLLGILFACQANEDPKYLEKIAAHRLALNESFNNPEESPLDSATFYTWKGLSFYPINSKYKVKAKLQVQENANVFELPHSHEKTKPYKVYGQLTFSLMNTQYTLNVLEQVVKKPGYENYLIVPFTDATNGNTTYGGGRYLDLEKNGATEVELDFNLAYNPYCAYNDKYTCPIPPKENNLNLAVEAGMKYTQKSD